MKKELSILNNTLHLFYINYEKLSQAKKKKAHKHNYNGC